MNGGVTMPPAEGWGGQCVCGGVASSPAGGTAGLEEDMTACLDSEGGLEQVVLPAMRGVGTRALCWRRANPVEAQMGKLGQFGPVCFSLWQLGSVVLPPIRRSDTCPIHPVQSSLGEGGEGYV